MLASENLSLTSAVTPHSGHGMSVSMILPPAPLTAQAEDVFGFMQDVVLTLPEDGRAYA